jgi:hypothetical protein
LVFIDVIWNRIDMAPLQGCAPRGRRLFAKIPHGRWHHDLPGGIASQLDHRTLPRPLHLRECANSFESGGWIRATLIENCSNCGSAQRLLL